MPNIIKVTKQDILNCALSITRKDGISNVNARSIARELHCSIQPIYYYFKTMDNLRKEIVIEVRNIYNSYILESKNDPNYTAFKAVGIAYIRFASLETNLFKLLFMSSAHNKFGIDANIDDNYDYILSTIDAPIEDAKRIYLALWITTHGVATMIATGFMKLTPEEISELLTSVYKGQVLLAKQNR
ncbi:MAG: TetR family transcriptional regulator [Crenarchaeota archaeon]|nr:TetR family transcriptional regulator [Thermoproteota archaeon]